MKHGANEALLRSSNLPTVPCMTKLGAHACDIFCTTTTCLPTSMLTKRHMTSSVLQFANTKKKLVMKFCRYPSSEETGPTSTY